MTPLVNGPNNHFLDTLDDAAAFDTASEPASADLSRFYGDTLLIILFQETGTELYVIFAWISVSGTGNKDKNHQYADGQNRFRSPASI
jgi:hypothetical protein